MQSSLKSPWFSRALAALIVLFPLWPLLRVHNSFATDWTNHVWMIGYFGEFFRRHLSSPITLNTDKAVGMAFPVFYGTLFYPIAGLLSILTGANLAMRLVIGGLLSLQTFQLIRTVRLCTSHSGLPYAIAALAAFGTYPLTNLYGRSAITEWVATSLLLSATCFWLQAAWTAESARAWRNGLLAGLLFTVAAGTHPITGVLGTCMFVVLAAVTLRLSAHRFNLVKIAAASILLAFIVLSPWLYATVSLNSHLRVSKIFGSVAVLGGLDTLRTRFYPFPYDATSVAEKRPSSMDLQINLPLLLLTIWLFWAARKGRAAFLRVAAGCALVAALALFSSISTEFWQILPASTAVIQYAYRLITYCDFALLLCCIFLLRAMPSFTPEVRQRTSLCLAVCVLIAIPSVLVKHAHTAGLAKPTLLSGTGFSDRRSDLIRMPDSFYGADSYVTYDLVNPLPGPPAARHDLAPDAESQFGEISAIEVPVWTGPILTNVQVFPWNQLTSSGQPVPAESLAFSGWFYALTSLPQSNLSYRTNPDFLWTMLRRISWLFLILWIGGLGVLYRSEKRLALVPLE